MFRLYTHKLFAKLVQNFAANPTVDTVNADFLLIDGIQKEVYHEEFLYCACFNIYDDFTGIFKSKELSGCALNKTLFANKIKG